MQKDISEMVFMMAASPRPVEAKVAEQGTQQWLFFLQPNGMSRYSSHSGYIWKAVTGEILAASEVNDWSGFVLGKTFL